MNLKHAVLSSTLSLVVTCVAAQDMSKSKVVGAGASSCGKYLETSAAGPVTRATYIAWMQGFLVGGNAVRVAHKEAVLDPPDYAAIGAFMDKYCRENPLESVADAGIELSNELIRRGGKGR